MKRVGQIYRESFAQNIRESMKNSNTTFLLSCSKLSASKMGEIRKDLSKSKANLFLAKNAIAKIVLKEMEYNGLAEKISGQTVFVWTNDDVAAISKVLVKFAKDIEGLQIQGGLIDGKVLEQADIKRLSELPSKEVLLAMLLSAIQSPLTRFAGTLNAKTRELLSVLKQLSDTKGGN